jgi:hypothetical protein
MPTPFTHSECRTYQGSRYYTDTFIESRDQGLWKSTDRQQALYSPGRGQSRYQSISKRKQTMSTVNYPRSEQLPRNYISRLSQSSYGIEATGSLLADSFPRVTTFAIGTRRDMCKPSQPLSGSINASPINSNNDISQCPNIPSNSPFYYHEISCLIVPPLFSEQSDHETYQQEKVFVTNTIHHIGKTIN